MSSRPEFRTSEARTRPIEGRSQSEAAAPERKKIKPAHLGWSVMAATLLADQLSKEALLAQLGASAEPIRITPFFDLVMVWNRGISFGMKFGLVADHPEAMKWVFIAVAGVIALWLSRWLAHTPFRLTALALGLVIGGAAGNVVDRLRFGQVADFFSFHIGPYFWPAFNVADSAICVGVALLCLESMLTRKALHIS